jgi:predicted DNA-binding protein
MKSKVKKDVKVALRISKGMRTELDSLASKNETTVSNVIRESVNTFINNN